MMQPVIGKGIKLGKSRLTEDRSKLTKRRDGKVREGESVAAYQRRVLGQIESLDWASEGGHEAEIRERTRPRSPKR
ncbi:hypothetical protein I6B53_02215 [Schaalia sp. 19OD2882]|uniref:hypothetical protein n=1 Tax=Schaalia sp. 19OD2882 TaxID=2794089 RepID=UPI001C1EB03C|nr:hypothetical protein [Schaalia sp. 19OD2882]QWW19948.1 hypothetical protein I6B53_02215 [Schaalia sp. 19OD2882]